MTLVETIGWIRRALFVQSLSIREIARRFRLSRKTVRTTIEAPEDAFAYERGKFGANPAMSGFCFDINVSCWRDPDLSWRRASGAMLHKSGRITVWMSSTRRRRSVSY